jgi:tRNA(Leu) C34 or U34 (ribose-2'-O)-methylase TrmL
VHTADDTQHNPLLFGEESSGAPDRHPEWRHAVSLLPLPTLQHTPCILIAAADTDHLFDPTDVPFIPG